ncbi:hypothetical protein H0X10_00600 [Candidatus Saccharibacteria bacterium]|nr:hypothetical protein [Candidatus Saccharibacteria bacterium]
MKKNIFVSIFISLVTLLLLAPSVMAARPVAGDTTTKPLGIDVSWPQCGKQLPTNHAFGIVGVNGGLATTTNPCLKDQLVWAKKSIGGTVQDKIQLYVNTANPGGLNTASWPKNNIDPADTSVSNPYGVCDGKDTLPCAWQYGWNRALEDVRDRFQPAATQAIVSTSPASYIWWLDVETENTWKLSGTSFDYESNTAVLEGMTAYFKTVNGRVGIYATGSQWAQIVGNAVGPNSNLIGLNNWRPGGASLSTAKQACSATPLTTGGNVVLTQFISKGLDYNYSCV